MQASAREDDNATRLTHDPELRLQFNWLFRLGLFAAIVLDLFDGLAPALPVPPVIVVVARAVAYGFGPVTWMERHGVLRLDSIDRDPPVQLAGRGGKPG